MNCILYFIHNSVIRQHSFKYQSFCNHNPLLQAKTPIRTTISVIAGKQLQKANMYQNVEHSHDSNIK